MNDPYEGVQGRSRENDLNRIFWEDISQFEQEMEKPYITSIERMGFARGLEQGRKEGSERAGWDAWQNGWVEGWQEERRARRQELQDIVLMVLDERFEDVPTSLADRLREIKSIDRLRGMIREALWVEAIDEFRMAE